MRVPGCTMDMLIAVVVTAECANKTVATEMGP